MAYWRGHIRGVHHEYTQALASYEQAIALYPNDIARPWQILRKCSHSIGDEAMAVRLRQHLIENPHSAV